MRRFLNHEVARLLSTAATSDAADEPDPKDLTIDLYRAGAEATVTITHRPTGTVAKATHEGSYEARRLAMEELNRKLRDS